MTIYHAGDKIRMSLTNVDSSGNGVDPGSVQLKYAVAGQATVTKNYPADIVRDGVGLYHYDFDTTGIVVTARTQLTEEWINAGTGQSIAIYKGSAIDPLPL